MGRISRRRINPDVEERIFTVFWQTLAELKTPDQIQIFLQSLLSFTEQTMLAKRLAIAVLLRRGHNYERIDNALKVSKSTILSIHRQIMIGTSGYKLAIDKILNKRQTDQLWDIVEELILKISLPQRYGSAKFQRRSQIGKELAKRKRQRNVL